jgi:hypothetical protein
MKKTSVFAGLVIIMFMGSCAKKVATATRDIKYMPIHFKPLARTDVTLVGNLEAEVAVGSNVPTNYKKGLITKSEATEIMYFAPGNGESITGSLYDNEVFNTVSTPKVPIIVGRKHRKASKKALRKAAEQDAAVDNAYYALIEKYPNIDYFINVRFDRVVTENGKNKYSEKIVVKADGLQLRTD